MSSAILYLAIVAIWACVLIPRWLRRDSARGAAAAQTSTPPAPVAHAEPAPGETDDYPDAYPTVHPAEYPADYASEDADDTPHPAPMPAVAPASGTEARRRMLAARRRLLLMLTVLEVAAVTLAVVGLAAIWVVIPPSVMLIGYLLLLREAAQADAERTRHEAEAAAHAREQARARRQRSVRDTPAEGTSTAAVAAAAAALAERLAAAPVAADYADSGPGRDFAPGLAGKYTTSNAGAETADEDYYYDSYDQPRLRAVGD